MNILFVALDFKPASGGIAEYTYQLARQAKNFGHSVHVLTRKRSNREQPFFPFPVAQYPFSKLKRRKMFGLVDRRKMIATLIHQYDIDLIISNSIKSEPIICANLSRRYNIPFWIFTYGREINSLYSAKFYKSSHDWLILNYVFKCVEKLFCVSKYTCDRLETLKVPIRSIAFVPPGIEPSDFDYESALIKNPSLEKRFRGKKLVLSISRLVERKGFDTVLKAFPAVLAEVPEAVYVIAGEGPFRSSLEVLAAEMDIQEKVHFLGYVNEDDKADLYRMAQLFVMPNRELKNGDVEGFGIVFLEANLFGLPVIAGNSGGAVDAVLHEQTGLVVNPNDKIEISSNIIRLLTDEDLAKELGKTGKERALEACTWESSGKRFESELQKLIPSDINVS